MSDTFRRVQRPLSTLEQTCIHNIKDEATAMLHLMDTTVPPNERSERSRCMQIARTKLEECVMWAVKGVTTDVYQ